MIDTHVAGRPDDIAATARYLRGTLAAGVTDLADTVAGQRTALQRAWQGEAGFAFTERAAVLARAGDEVARVVAETAMRLDALASVLRDVQRGLAALRADAAAAGLRVAGETIHPPDGSGGPPGAAAAYAFARTRRDELLAQWAEALARAATYVERNAVDLAQVTTSLLVTGYSAELKRRAASVLSGEAAHQRTEARRLGRYADDLAEQLRDGRLRAAARHLDHYQELRDRAGQAVARADDADHALRHVRLPRPLGAGLGLLGPGLAVYGAYDDMRHGESFEQAAASQGGGLLAGMASGAIVGSALGSAGLPVAGTLAGGVVGAVTGAVTSHAVDRHYEEQEAAAAEAAIREEEHLVHLLDVSDGLPLYATPGSDGPLYGEGSR